MGCTSFGSIEQRRVLPLPQETVNSYIDKFPAIILQKIKQKFQILADQQTRELDCPSFIKLFSSSKLSQQSLQRLFNYFNDNRKQNIKFMRFMMKYAIITKCESQLLFKILFEIYKTNFEQETMNKLEFDHFIQCNNQFIEKVPFFHDIIISKERFVEIIQTGFNSIEFQKKLVITSEDDVPFQAIAREIQDCDFNDLVEGRNYYLLSNSWYNRWTFYYQEVNHTIDKTHIKSTKMLLPLDSSGLKKKKKKRTTLNESIRSSGQTIPRTSQMKNSLIEQPNSINFDDIEGEYKGQLKENLKISQQTRTITDNLWKLLCSLHPPEQEFKRMALNYETIQYYPRTVFYIEADQKGNYKLPSQKIKHLSISKSVDTLFNLEKMKSKTVGEIGIFTKNFFEKNWREIDYDKIGSDISLQPRFFIAVAMDREAFIEHNFRKQLTTKNLDLGDKVFAYFPYIKNSSEAVILGLVEAEAKKYKLHFKGYSYKYQINFAAEDLVIEDTEPMLASLKIPNESLVRGINNIGNTCFMNSIIQCLVATPILDKFLQEFPFDEKKQPIGYGLSKIAKALLNNEKSVPFFFKKIIDVHMPLFSGYNQHDAQQFLNLLLDKVTEELKQKPTVIDYLFGGKTISRLTCVGCKKVKKIPQNMYILSLPIPEAEFNYYSVIMVPVTSNAIKKVILRLHNSSIVSDYIRSFEERTGQSFKDYNFCQIHNNSLKKIKSELITTSFQKKKLLQAYWTICKTNTKSGKNGKISVEYLNQDEEVQVVKMEEEGYDDCTKVLGRHTTTDVSYKKLLLRKYNSSLKRLEEFGLQFLIGIPRWASYNDVIEIVEKFIVNMKTKTKYRKQEGKEDYVIKLRDPSKTRCIFCLKDSPSYNIDETEIGQCCSAFDKDIPLGWASKHKKFWIYVDWINFSALNSMFCSYIELDSISRSIEESKQQEFIQLEECFKLHNEMEKVEMECDSCKQKFQNLEHLIGGMPNILVVHMKQFRYTTEGHLIKLDLRLKWEEFFDSSKFAFTVQGKLYELFGLVRHSGNSESGHYTCMTKRKHPFENKNVWVNFDDDITEIIEKSQKVIDDAYLLFYKKVDMPTSSLVIYSQLKEE